MKKFLPFLMLLTLVAATTQAATTYRYSDSVTTVRGDAVGGASVTVYLAGTTTKASLYLTPSSDGSTRANPTYTDGYGRYYFYVLPGTYDIAISGTNVTTYTVEDVRVFSDTGYVYNVVDYGANGADSVTDSTAIKAAVAAVKTANGGTLYFPPGVYIASDINIRGLDIAVEISTGATIASTKVGSPAFRVDASDNFLMFGGGRIVGPGVSVALTTCNGVLVDSLSNAVFSGIDISGFRSGIRATNQTSNITYSGLDLHDMKFCGLWPHSGDIVIGCRFEDIGTESTNHGIYMDQATRGVVLSGNYYKNISGAGVQIYSPTDAFYDISCTGEVFERCGVGYIIAGTPAENISIYGAVIDSCENVGPDERITGIGIKILGTSKNLDISATISYPDSLLIDTNTSLSDSRFNIVGVGSEGRGVAMYGNDCSGNFVIDDCKEIGFYLSGGDRNTFSVRTRGNTSNGIYISGSVGSPTKRNVLNVYTTRNTVGVGITTYADSNIVYGVSGANSSNNLDNGGTGNVTTGLVTW